ncbi:MAG: nitroreductase family protein [Thermoplasmatota archaeon]
MWGGDMDLDLILDKRHSVRSYTTMAPSERDVEKLVLAANKAPTAGNLKARKVFVFKSESKRRSMMEAALHQTFIAEAPYLLLFCADRKAIDSYGDRGRDLYCVQDATISATFAMLKATELGLGTCWIGAFDEQKVSEAAGLPEYLRPVAILTVGYEK